MAISLAISSRESANSLVLYRDIAAPVEYHLPRARGHRFACSFLPVVDRVAVDGVGWKDLQRVPARVDNFYAAVGHDVALQV